MAIIKPKAVVYSATEMPCAKVMGLAPLPVFCEAVERELVRLETQNYEDEPEFDEEGEQAGSEEYYTEENMPEINLDEQ